MESSPYIVGLILVLARLGGILIFVPVPGARTAPPAAKILLTLSLSLTLLPTSLALRVQPVSLGELGLWLAGEVVFGLMAGLFVGFLTEGLAFGLQSIAIQAGFSYSSTIDPTSEADSGVLQTIALTLSNLLFFHLGGDAMVIRAFSRSLNTWPPGSVMTSWSVVEAITAFGSATFDYGLRLALPLGALLLLADLTLALTARIQSQLQLLSLAFPIKMLGSLAFLALLLPVAPILYRSMILAAANHLSRLIR